MGQETLAIELTVQADGSLLLDEKLNLPAGRVRVTVQPLKESAAQNAAEFLAMMERIWADQKARGQVPRTREEIDAAIDQLRNEAEEEFQAVERLFEECERLKQPGRE